MSERHWWLGASREQLGRALAQGGAVPLERLGGTLWRGVSLGLPVWAEKLSWKTFAKTFYQDAARGTLRGWNVRLAQTGVDGALEPLRDRRGVRRTFGHYRVRALGSSESPQRCGPGVMLDYGAGGNGVLDPTHSMRDPVVAVGEDDTGWPVLLGWSYARLGPLNIGTPSYFVLRYGGALDHVVEPPAG